MVQLRLTFLAGAAALAFAGVAFAQNSTPTNSHPNPYKSIANYLKMPMGRSWGSTAGVTIDIDGQSVWAVDRCGANSCVGSNLDPIVKFDKDGKFVRSFGGRLFAFPHGIAVDKEGNVWVTDAGGGEGRGHTVVKFGPDGKVLMTLGTQGVTGTDATHFYNPSAVLIAPNGDIFIGDGHGGMSNNRIIKFDKTGKFLMQWGEKGAGPGQFDTPHTMAMDSQGRLFIGNRNNNRIDLFTQDGKFIESWPQFSRPSGVYIDANDVIDVADSESESVSKNHDGWKRGLRIGSAKDGSVKYFIPDPIDQIDTTSTAEGIAADKNGIIYGAEVFGRRMMRYTMR
jgi:sugar lactone lactonase YvrE